MTAAAMTVLRWAAPSLKGGDDDLGDDGGTPAPKGGDDWNDDDGDGAPKTGAATTKVHRGAPSRPDDGAMKRRRRGD